MATRTAGPEFCRPSTLWVPDMALPAAPDSWIEDLLSIANFNLDRGLIFLCMVCKGEGGRLRGLYNGQHFEEGGDGYGHYRLQLYEVDSYVCVKKYDMQSLGVNVENVQSILDKQDSSCSSYIFLHSDCEFFLEPNSSKSMEYTCFNCGIQLANIGKKTAYCCLECSYYAVDLIRNSITGRLSFPLPSPVAKQEQDIENASFPSYARVVKTNTVKQVLLPQRLTTDKRVDGTSKSVDGTSKSRCTQRGLDFLSFDVNEYNVAPDNCGLVVRQGSREQAPVCPSDDEKDPRVAKLLVSDDDKDSEESSTLESDTSSRASMEEDRGAKPLDSDDDRDPDESSTLESDTSSRASVEGDRGVKPLDSQDDLDPEESSPSESDTSRCASLEEDIVHLSHRLGSVAARSSIRKILRGSKFPHVSEGCILRMITGLLRLVAEEIENQCYGGENEATDLMGAYDNPTAADHDKEILCFGAEAHTGYMTPNFPSPADTMKIESSGAEACTGDMTCRFLSSATTVKTESSGNCSYRTKNVSFQRV